MPSVERVLGQVRIPTKRIRVVGKYAEVTEATEATETEVQCSPLADLHRSRYPREITTNIHQEQVKALYCNILKPARDPAAMNWSNETIMDFLDFYESEPIIWNQSFSNHKNRDEVFTAWKRIEKKMNQKGHLYNVNDLKKKKDSLLASFRSCYNRVKQSMKNAAIPEDVYKPSWFAYDKIFGFLKDQFQSKETNNSEGVCEIYPETVLSEESSDSVEYEDDFLDNIPLKRRKHMNSSAHNDDSLASSSKTIMKAALRKRKKVLEEGKLKKKMDSTYPILQSELQRSRSKNLCDIYGELIVAKLKALNERSREICMHRIDVILFEMKMNLTDPHYLEMPPLAVTKQPAFNNSTSSGPSRFPSFHHVATQTSAPFEVFSSNAQTESSENVQIEESDDFDIFKLEKD